MHFARLLAAVLCLFTTFSIAQDEEQPVFSSLRHIHRINAHGDEFMSMDMSPDRSRLAIGTEKGDVYIWNIAAGKIENQFHERGPVHQVSFIDSAHVVVAGGNHTGVHTCLLGRLDITSGKLEEWAGAGNDTLMYLSVDRNSGRVAVGGTGEMSVWDSGKAAQIGHWKSDKVIASLVLAGPSLFVARLDQTVEQLSSDDADSELRGEIVKYSVSDVQAKPVTFLAPKKGLAGKLTISPDMKVLSANVSEDEKEYLAFFDPVTAAPIGNIDAGHLNLRWISDQRAIVSDEQEPKLFVTVSKAKGVASEEISKGGGWHGSGTPVDVSGQAVSTDQKTVWLSYQKIGCLLEFDLPSKTSKALILLRPFPYAMDVRETASGGYLATAGDDKFVRVWDLKDLSLVREVRTDTTPQGVAILSDGQRVVYSQSSDIGPTQFDVLDIGTGRTRHLLSVPMPFAGLRAAGDGFVYEESTKVPPTPESLKTDPGAKPTYPVKKLIVASGTSGEAIKAIDLTSAGVRSTGTSQNSEWIAVADDSGFLWRVNSRSGKPEKFDASKIDSPTKITITNDGRYIYTTTWGGKLFEFDTASSKQREIGDGYRGEASCLRLSVDEKWAIVGGNHFDIGVYEIATGKTGFYTRVDASDFYVPQAWMKGNRLIYLTDGGVMFDGILSK